MISAIAAISSNGMLGLDNWLPWDIPEELAYFEQTITGSALVIGRKTYESMDVVPEEAFIVTRQTDLRLKPGCHRADSVEQALARAKATGRRVFVIGGASIYAAAWPYCEQFFLTRIEMPFEGDTKFPESVQFDACHILSDISRSYLEEKLGSR